jgi:nucleoside-diphosphate-sugar epimerase
MRCMLSSLISTQMLVAAREAGVRRFYIDDCIEGTLRIARGDYADRSTSAQLGWEPSLPLRAGMAKTYAWVAEQVERELAEA